MPLYLCVDCLFTFLHALHYFLFSAPYMSTFPCSHGSSLYLYRLPLLKPQTPHSIWLCASYTYMSFESPFKWCGMSSLMLESLFLIYVSVMLLVFNVDYMGPLFWNNFPHYILHASSLSYPTRIYSLSFGGFQMVDSAKNVPLLQN